MEALEVRDLTVKYNGITAIEDVNFAVGERSILGILGPNGGGKSTLLKAIVNLVKPFRGQVKVADGRSLAYVPQFASFEKAFPISVSEVILMGSIPGKISAFYRYSREKWDKASEIMKFLGIYELGDRQIGELSGGQLQKVLIGRALMTGADIILFDEPTANLDRKVKEDISNLISHLKENKTILIVTHDTIYMEKYLDRVLYLNKKVLYDGRFSKMSDRLERGQ